MEAFIVSDPKSRTAPIEPLPKGDRNGNPAGLSLLTLIREDLRTHDNLLFEQGFWALAVHRFGNWRMGIRWKLFRAPMSILYRGLYRIVEWICGISLPYTVPVGRRVRIWHHSGMVLHARSIGNDVHIRQNTTFGVAHRGQNEALPVIEDGADIGCHVCILGNVRIGSGAVVGAGSVVLTDVPPGTVAVGVPARVLPARELTDSKLTMSGSVSEVIVR
jgi:serine O-acetyltransferase